MQYELFYLIGASQEAEMEKIKEAVDEIITSNGGVFEEKETLEKRRLSYKIKKENHGIYIARRFELEKTENFKEINSKLNLENRVMRFIISRADELPELKSKEERIGEAVEKEKEDRKEIKKQEKIKEEKSRLIGNLPENQGKIKEDKSRLVGDLPERQEDIDTKLEEILNI